MTVCLFFTEGRSSGTEGAKWSLPHGNVGRCAVDFGAPGIPEGGGDAFLLLGFWMVCSAAVAEDLGDAEKLFQTGKYDECAKAVDAGIENDGWSEAWRHLKIKTELARGRDKEAIAALEEALLRFPASISLHLLGSQVYRQTRARSGSGASSSTRWRSLIPELSSALLDARGLVTIGRFFLLRGEDARKVLDQCYDVVTKQAPDFVEV